MNIFRRGLKKIKDIIQFGIKGSNYIRLRQQDLSDKGFLEQLILHWKSSPERLMQIKGELYYRNEHDILARKRTMIGEGGKLQVVENLPNNHLIDNQYGKMVNQKVNYLLGQPISFESDNKSYTLLLNQIFDRHFMKIMKNAGKAALNHGIAWLYPYYDRNGKFSFRLFPGYEILPFWEDSEHTVLAGAVRLYLTSGFDGISLRTIEKVEVFDLKGVHCYILEGNVLLSDATAEEQDCAYVMNNGKGLNWSRIPLIPLKYNDQEIPLLKKVKSLQDGLNAILSDFTNHMQEDARNTIIVLKNFDGTDLGEFRKNLALFGAIKVRDDGETECGVETLEITVNAENYKVILEIFKKALIENAMGYDAKDDRLSGNPNQMNIQSMYSDIDLDANDMETEFQAAFEEILWFVNNHLANMGKGDFEGEKVEVIFNKDVLINETEAIENCQKSVGILSDRTVIGQHPWIDDIDKEMERLQEQRQKEQEEMEKQYEPFGRTEKQTNGAASGKDGVEDAKP